MDKRKGITLFDKSVSKFKTLIKSGPVFMLYVIVVIVRNLLFFKKCIDTMLIKRFHFHGDVI